MDSRQRPADFAIPADRPRNLCTDRRCNRQRDLKKVLGEEADEVLVHGLLGVFLAAVVVVVAEDALDAEWIEHGLERGAEAGVVNALAGTGSGGKWYVGLGVKENHRRIVGGDMVQR